MSQTQAQPAKRRGRKTKKSEVENVVEKMVEEARAQVPDVQPSTLLSHLGNYRSEPFDILQSYFEGNPLERLVRHQLESYNNFVNFQMQRTIEMFNPIVIKSDADYDPDTNTYGLIVKVSLKNIRFQHPQIYENNGAMKTMMPQEARLRNFTYSSGSIVDLHIEYVIRDDNGEERTIQKVLPKIKLCQLPVMLKSSICILTQYNTVAPELTGECDMDCGGYFIIKGSEKTVLCQERAAENRIYVFNGKNTPKWSWVAEFKSVPDSKCISPKQVEMLVSSKTNIYGHGIYVVIPRMKQKRYIELFVLFRALGVLSDKRICEYILLNVDEAKNKPLLEYLQASMEDAKAYLQSNETAQQEALEHVMSMLAYNPYQQDKKAPPISKEDYTTELFQNDFFPHCKSLEQKLFLLGFMANRLIRTAIGWNPPDDRDSYLNKRIELAGSLLNNLFRNHYIRFVKDMEKQIIREINIGAWKSSEEYENIISMTNVYKIVKPTTIENGLNRALSTGDFSVKQSNSSSKVGVAQVLNRLTYLGTLSHLRRVNTPLEKNGELVAPRKLHNTTWGFLCPVETPEGQSIGIVKNLSFMTHITIPTNSESLYAFVKPYVLSMEDVTHPNQLYDEVKVFINGSWVGIAKDPVWLYRHLKQKKHKGLINIYTSVSFDYVRMEIRICNDGGRMTRPVLKVENNAALITTEIIEKLKNKDLHWNDLLTDCRLEESVVEYIDPDEQNHTMIGMRFKGKFMHEIAPYYDASKRDVTRYEYCEIHPCTILGVLGSCVPFPDCNQAPRNTYQCAMAKQAIGISAMNFDKRMDKTTYALNYPMRPLVDTRIMDFLQLNRIPSGNQIHVAIMSHTGYNQEDSVLINQAAIDRGMFSATIYHTEKDEDKNVIRDEIIRCKPDPAKTKGIKHGNYDKLNMQGFIPENTEVQNRDIIIAKVAPIKENRNDPTKVIKYEDQSKSFRTTEETYIDKNYTGRNGEGCNFAKTRVRTFRKPVIGDKFCIKESSSILTDQGWVAFKDIDTEVHKVATLLQGETLAYVTPIAKYEFDCEDEELYSMDAPHVKMVCTMGHNVYVKQKLASTFGFMKAKYVMDKQLSYKIDAVNDIVSSDYMEFRKVLSRIRHNMDRLPEETWLLTQVQCREILSKILELSPNRHEYHAKDLILAEDVQRLCLHAGLSATLKFCMDYGVIVRVNREKMYADTCIGKESIELYTGKVGCIEVPDTHLFYYKDSEYAPPVWTGNSSRHGQKGTVGNILPECDMPYTRDGLRPDLILNPHAIPSRMTIAHLKETMLGKVLVELGMFGDGTSFGDLDVYSIANELQKCGFESYGNEIMYDGATGKQLETSVFIGPVFYQRLKHMVNDKEHSRSIGPVVNLTRQPAEGRSRDGGFRIGEMERDVMIAHGMSKFCRERMYDVADKYAVHVCKKCGMLATFNNGDKGLMRCKQGMTVHRCSTCDNTTDFAYVQVPYAYKLMSQELQCINVVPRIVTN
jgi:DNA-directed RNA polymerase II subunit RPB2